MKRFGERNEVENRDLKIQASKFDFKFRKASFLCEPNQVFFKCESSFSMKSMFFWIVFENKQDYVSYIIH